MKKSNEKTKTSQYLRLKDLESLRTKTEAAKKISASHVTPKATILFSKKIRNRPPTMSSRKTFETTAIRIEIKVATRTTDQSAHPPRKNGQTTNPDFIFTKF